MRRTKSWLALLLLLHLVVHPLLHEARLLVPASGTDATSAAIAGDHSQTRDCELCRVAGNLVPIVQFDVLEFYDTSSPVVTHPNSKISGAARLLLSARAPPAC